MAVSLSKLNDSPIVFTANDVANAVSRSAYSKAIDYVDDGAVLAASIQR